MTRKRPPKPLNAPPPKERKVRPKKPATANKSVRLTVDLWDRIEAASKERGIRSRNSAIIEGMEAWLEKPAEPKAPAPQPPLTTEVLADMYFGREPPNGVGRVVIDHGPVADAISASIEHYDAKRKKQLGEALFAPTPGSLVSTPPGAKLSAPKPESRWDWAKPERRKK